MNFEPINVPPNAILHSNDQGHTDWYMVPDEPSQECSFTGTCFTVAGWNADGSPAIAGDEVARIYLKWDGCCHLGLRDPQLGNNWVHICTGIDETIAMLKWMWEQARARIPAWDAEVAGKP